MQHTVISKKNGGYKITDLAPGTYDVWAEKGSLMSLPAEVQVFAGQTTGPVDLRLLE